MEVRPSGVPEARRILDLARRDRRAAEKALADLPIDAQVGAVCEAPAGRRAALLELMPEPEKLIPLIPEAELCFAVKASGLSDAGWILEHATPAQIVAGVDLDAWQGLTPDLEAVERWMTTLAEAGAETLLRGAHALDPELIVLYMRDRVDVYLDPKDDDWQPPDRSQTIEGQFYLVARRTDDDLEPLLKLLHALFTEDYWLYFRMMQGVIWELPSELEEWSLRWRTGRLQDLGFPSWDESMRMYGYLRPEQRAELPAGPDPLTVEAWDFPVWIPELPAVRGEGHLLFSAAAELGEEERRAFFYAFVGTANKVAVADQMPLGEPETLPMAIERLAVTASRGLEYVAKANQLGAADVLRRATLERLFRVGVSLEQTPLVPPAR
jgi:hypothetical protein